MASKRKAVDLDELLRDGKKVFVKNTSRPMGQIVLTFVTSAGKAEPRPIPRTWIPICLTDSLSPEIIRTSNDLRLFLQKGIIELIDPEEALQILSTTDAQEEAKRLHTSAFSSSASATQKILKMEAQQTYSPSINNPMAPVDTVVADPVNNRVKSTLLRVEAKDMTERDAVAEFRVMKGELTNHDLTYIISQSEDEGPLRRFAYQTLSELAAEVDQDIIADDAPEDPEEAAKGRARQHVNE